MTATLGTQRGQTTVCGATHVLTDTALSHTMVLSCLDHKTTCLTATLGIQRGQATVCGATHVLTDTFNMPSDYEVQHSGVCDIV